MNGNRRNLIKQGLSLPLLASWLAGRAFAQDSANPTRKRFLLQIHMDSMCGVSSGLVQPLKVGTWPKGFNEAGSSAGSTNPHLNAHTQAGHLIFHNYIKFLAAMANDMCLVAGTSQSLDHNAAFNLQNRGSSSVIFNPEWSMAVGEFMKTTAQPNPIVLTGGNKTGSVADIVPVVAADLGDFKTVTHDVPLIPNVADDPIMTRLKGRFAQTTLGSVLLDKNLGGAAVYQLDTLAKGLAQLNNAEPDIQALAKFFNADNSKKMVSGAAEPDRVLSAIGQGGQLSPPPHPFREKLKLAGILAKTGLASGMTISITRGFEDTHVGGADVNTARNAAVYWLLIAQFWQWVRSVNLQDDLMIVISHDFTRTAYNGYRNMSADVVDPKGKKINVAMPGRDHALAMGMMFINGKVPKAGRIGAITDNIVPVATKDALGSIDADGLPYLSHNIVGSMMMRVFDDLFPDERAVRKHWPAFAEVTPITAA